MSTVVDEVLARLTAEGERHVAGLVDHIAIPSVSAENRGVREAAEHIARRAEQWGLSPSIVGSSGRSAVGPLPDGSVVTSQPSTVQ